jgi:hypothetical protein
MCLAVALLAAGCGDAASALGETSGEPAMAGQLGAYSMTREASGTSWQPDSTPMAGLTSMGSDWMTMWHGFANLAIDRQGGPRGASETFSNSMLMFMARRGEPDGALGVRIMVSADPLMGPAGYPELFQTGETADGVHPLIDRQHPHNLLMEAAVTYSIELARRRSLFAYAALAGEPALGPPAFMHRFSGEDNPEAPLTHHWLDSTHVSYGVFTAGYVWDRLKLEASGFNGREPDQHRYDVEWRAFDSWSARLSLNPTADLALQLSTGRLARPEQLEPGVAIERTTASISYNRMLSALQWQTTLAWGHNQPGSGTASNAWLLETGLRLCGTESVFARAERVGKDDLFVPGQFLYGPTYTVAALSLGYIHDFLRIGAGHLGAGLMGTVYQYPGVLRPAYGAGPASGLLFVRIRL